MLRSGLKSAIILFCTVCSMGFLASTQCTGKQAAARAKALEFMRAYVSDGIDPIVKEIEEYAFEEAHGKWNYYHKLQGQPSFGSWVDRTKSELVEIEYYGRTHGTSPAEFAKECSETERHVFDVMRGLEADYGLREIVWAGRIFDFGLGGRYYHDTSDLPLPNGLGVKGAEVRQGWFVVE